VPGEEAQPHRQRGRVHHARGPGEQWRPPRVERAEDAPERLDVRVDPVVAVLYLDRVRQVELDARGDPDAVACLPDVRGVAGAVRVAQREVAGLCRGLRGLGHRSPVDVAGGVRSSGDGPDAPEDVHAGERRPPV
jgi:hypothetical protein